MTEQEIDATITHIQEILDRDYPHLEWRVLPSPPMPDGSSHARWLYVLARTRDFRYRCRVGRPLAVIAAASPLQLLVAELATEAEQRLADLTATP
jgi:hypothetical protein